MENEEKILITRPKIGAVNEYVNDLTKFMDTMVVKNDYPDFCSTYIYIWEKDNKKIMTIRFPGASRGGLVLDENSIITDIILHEDTCFGKNTKLERLYKGKLAEEIKRFIGYNVEISEEPEEYDRPNAKPW